jgi:hypothetical protein
MKPIPFLAAALAALTANAAPRHVVIVVGPNIPPALHASINQRLESVMSSGEPGTIVTVLNGDTFQTVSSVTLTDSKEFLQRGRNASAIQAAVLSVLQSTNTLSVLSVPRVLDEISRQIRPVNGSILLIGDAYPCFSSEGYCLSTNWPADLQLRDSGSVFNTTERGHQMEATTVHWLATDPKRSTSERHRSGMERFYSLFVANQGGALVTFTPDVTTAFQSAFSGRRDPFLQVAVNPSDTNRLFHWVGEPPVEMRVFPTITTQEVKQIVIKTVTNWVEEVRRAPSPWPAVPLGKTGIGVLWTTPSGESRFVDVDLHVPVSKEGVELSWKNRSCKSGRYFRDIQKSDPNPSPDWKNSWEFVELDGAQLPEAIYLNRYAGSAAVTGEVRIEYNGRVQVIAFVLPAGPGNKGGDTTRRDRSPQWLRIDLRSLALSAAVNP